MTTQRDPAADPRAHELRNFSKAAATGWTLVYWSLIAPFLLAATLNVLQEPAGFLTSYLADLTAPALVYVLSRRLLPNAGTHPFMRWLGRTPESAAVFLFAAASAIELSQPFWPSGFFAGRFDPWDIVAYGAGLLACYVPDKLTQARSPLSEGASHAG